MGRLYFLQHARRYWAWKYSLPAWWVTSDTIVYWIFLTLDLLGNIPSSNNEPPEPLEPPGPPQLPPAMATTGSLDDDNDDNGVDDSWIIKLALNSQKFHASIYVCIYIYYTNHQFFSVKHVYPDEANEPGLIWLIQESIYEQYHPNSSAHNILNLPPFYEKITIHTSTVAAFHAPSNLSSIGGMKHEHIHAVNFWRNGPGCYDTMFINTTHRNMDDNADPLLCMGFLILRLHKHTSSFFLCMRRWSIHVLWCIGSPIPVMYLVISWVCTLWSLITIIMASLLLLSFTWTQSLGLLISYPFLIFIQCCWSINTLNRHLICFLSSISISILIIMHSN